MFEKSSSWQRYSGKPAKIVRVHLGHVPQLDPRPEEDRSALRIALTVAVLFHVAFFVMQLPEMAARPTWVGQERPVYVVQQIRFKPPPPARQQQLPQRKEKTRVIPIPDPTPDDPEPIRVEEVEVPDIQVSDLDVVFGIPEGPTANNFGGAGVGPMQVGGDVLPPQRLLAPSPPYTEDARKGRIQGIVILEAIIDAMGNVTNVKVLKGLPMGLSDTAVEAAGKWKFKPATRNGAPVPVFFNLTIRFSLQ
jgi:protein TonB